MQNRFGNLIPLFYQEIILSPGVFRRETASGFYPWGKVEGPRKRVAEGLCGWRHGNSFPMTQSAQSLCQMRSIPRCSKAVFYVFIFDYIHDSATMHNTQEFSTDLLRVALETCRRHVPMLWCGFVWGQWKITGGNDYALLPNREWNQKQKT